MDITVGELVVRYLQKLGVTHVFGIPGAHILPVFDKLYDSDIKTILTKHEQGAAFMASGYARRSGKIGACIATTGPGATNLVTGIANAFMNGTPVLAITGETPTYSFGKGALQESSGEGTAVNQNHIFRGVTKYHKLVQRIDYLPHVLRSATSALYSAVPGPVLLSFPYNVLREKVDANILEDIETSKDKSSAEDCTIPLEGILELVRKAEHPVIIAGYGCVSSRTEGEIFNFCTQLNIPVATSLKARGVIPETDDLSLGVLGITSKELAYRYVTEKADLLIFLGVSFGERTSYNWNPALLNGKKIIQVDINPAQLEKTFEADLAICCDVKKVLNKLEEALKANPIEPKDTSYLPYYRDQYNHSTLNDEDFSLISYFLTRLHERLNGNAVIFDDNIIYMQHYVNLTKSRRYFPNSGISSLGHAVPAAIGAKLSTSKPTLAILGDGGFQMCCMELMTAVNYQIPVTVILLNNSSLGLVRKNQYYNYSGRYIACDFLNPDYACLARAFGINYGHVASNSEADMVIEQIDFQNGINLIEVMMNKDGFPTYSSGR
ncbi:MAG: thiamine pyrophosphate-binding protein [Deltaproteobacteria bacterium]|jgi:acetolactate synthase-1/2/3 large subunit|nr:MAG: thiamine pyrophosphate-binding protein [Deltaproteobacteria bacterium]